MSVSIGSVSPWPSRVSWTRIARFAGAAAAAGLGSVLLASLSGFAFQAAGSWRDLHRYPPLGQMVDVGGVRLHLVCIGQGSPTVVLDGPIGASWLGWHQVQPEIARTTRVCAYDRAGYGWSDPGIPPRDSGQIASELYLLLTRARVAPPFVLVGAAFGALDVRLFAVRHARDVAGVVLVDAIHEDLLAPSAPPRLPASGDLLALDLLRLSAHVGVPRLLDAPIGEAATGALPSVLQPMARAVGFRSSWFEAVYRETAALEQSLELARALIPRAAPLLGDRPLVIVGPGSASAARPGGGDARGLLAAMQRRLARESTNSLQITGPDGGPSVLRAKPRAVVDAVGRVVLAVRAAAGGARSTRGSSWRSP